MARSGRAARHGLEDGTGFDFGRLDVGLETGFEVGLRGGFPFGGELDATAVEKAQLPGLDEFADFAGEGGAVLFVQVEQTPEHEVVGGAVIGFAQFGEEAVAEGHVKSRWRRALAELSSWPTKRRSPWSGDENRPRGQ